MANTMRVLLARGSFATLGGAEREFINTANQLHKSMKVDLAALDFPEHCRDLINPDIPLILPENEYIRPSSALDEILARGETVAEKLWTELGIDWSKYDLVHLSNGYGSLGIVPLIPKSIPIHYRCLEPPRWLYDDVLHRHPNGKAKRPMLITKAAFSLQRKYDRKKVKEILSRPGSAISGNSPWTMKTCAEVYSLDFDADAINGQPPRRDDKGRSLSSTFVYAAVNLDEWMNTEDLDSDNCKKETGELPEKYVVTIGNISYGKGTYDTVSSLESTGIALIQAGGGTSQDKQDLVSYGESIGVEVFCMPRLSSQALRWLVMNSVAMVSHARNEPFGLTPLEAMAIGIPALMVDEGGFHHTMKGSNSGLAINRENREAWLKAYSDSQIQETRDVWSKNGKQHVSQGFGYEDQEKALMMIWNDCIEHKA